MNQEEMSNENLMSLLQTSNFGEQGNVSALQVLQIQEGEEGVLVPMENVQTPLCFFTLTPIGWYTQTERKLPVPFSLGPSVMTLVPFLGCGLWRFFRSSHLFPPPEVRRLLTDKVIQSHPHPLFFLDMVNFPMGRVGRPLRGLKSFLLW